MKNKILIGSILFVLLALLVVFWPRVAKAPLPDTSAGHTPTVQDMGEENRVTPSAGTKVGILTAGKIQVRVEIAETDNELELGLGNRDTIADDAGMLFILGGPDLSGIWMKDMRFPLDILWLDEAFRVVDMRENIAVETYPEIFYSKKPAWYVVEMKGKATAKQGITIGTVFSLKR